MESSEKIVSYAQNREDVILDAFFLGKNAGTYVDVGASDPDTFSVTKHFYDRGWHGINIEPNQELHRRLMASRPRDINLCVAAGDVKSKEPFSLYEEDGLSTLSPEVKEKLQQHKHAELLVEVRRLDDILEENHFSDIDFMKIDVEGYEYEVIRGNNWEKFRPAVLCVEADKIQKDWPTLLEKAGYRQIFFDGLNNYYIDESKKIAFNYKESVIGRDIISATTATELNALSRRLQASRAENHRLMKLSAEKDEHIEFLNQHIYEQNRLRSIVKNLVVKIHTVVSLRLSSSLRKKKQYPLIQIDPGEERVMHILDKVYEADRHVFMKKPGLRDRTKRGVAKASFGAYKYLTHGTANGLRKLRRILRRGK